MAMTRQIRLYEYGRPCIVQAEDWQTSQLDGAVSKLKTIGAVTHEQIGANHVLGPTNFVGVLSLPGRVIRIAPRFPQLFSALHALLSFAPQKAALIEAGILSSLDSEFIDPASAFINALEDTLAEGLPFLYERHCAISSHPKGRIDFGRTLKLLNSRGISHKAVFSHNERKPNQQFEQVVQAVDTLLSLGGYLTNAQRVSLDRCLVAIGKTVAASPLECVQAGDALCRTYSDRKDIVRLMTIATTILREECVLWELHIPFENGEANFCQMDRVWERSVAAALGDAFKGSASYRVGFHPLGSSAVRLFEPRGPLIDPDIVIYDTGKPVIVVDGKYSVAESASATDVYQIVCYARKLKADQAALVYVTRGQSWIKDLGQTDDGIRVQAVGVAIANATDGLRQIAEYVRNCAIESASPP